MGKAEFRSLEQLELAVLCLGPSILFALIRQQSKWKVYGFPFEKRERANCSLFGSWHCSQSIKIPESVRHVCFTFGYTLFHLVNPFHYKMKRPIYVTFTSVGCCRFCSMLPFYTHTCMHTHTDTECFVFFMRRTKVYYFDGLNWHKILTLQNSLENNMNGEFGYNLGLVASRNTELLALQDNICWNDVSQSLK